MIQYFPGRHAKTLHFQPGQVDAAALGIGADIAQDVGELQGFAQVAGVVAGGGVFTPKNPDAQQPHHRGHAVAVGFQLFIIVVCLDFQIHFAALDQFVKQLKRQAVFPDDRLEFLIDGKLRRASGAGQLDVPAPFGEPGAAEFRGRGIFIGHIVHLAAKGVERRHGVAFGPGQEYERQRQIGRAFAGDGLTVLHQLGLGGGLPGLVSSPRRTGGRPPTWARVGLMRP